MKICVFVYSIILLHLPIQFSLARETQRPSIELKFGPEFTFTNLDFKNGPDHLHQSLHELANRCQYLHGDKTRGWCYNFLYTVYNHLVLGQPKEAQFSVKDLVFESPNGWNFKISLDPGVLEIKMAPMGIDSYKKFASDIQDAIFVSAANTGLFPWDYQGGGHVNIGLSEIAENPLLLRNFLVDLYNHPELTMGAWGYDTNNALPWHMTSEKSQEQFQKVIQKFDQGVFKKIGGIKDFLKAVRKSFSNIPFEPYGVSWKNRSISRSKHIGVSLHHIDSLNKSEERIEIRSFRPQKDIYQFIRQIELLQARINYLNGMTEPLPIHSPDYLVPHSVETHLLQPPIRPQDALKNFYLYVKESGQRWDQHRDYLWPNWIENGELERFENSDFFITQERSADESLELPNDSSPCQRSLTM